MFLVSFWSPQVGDGGGSGLRRVRILKNDVLFLILMFFDSFCTFSLLGKNDFAYQSFALWRSKPPSLGKGQDCKNPHYFLGGSRGSPPKNYAARATPAPPKKITKKGLLLFFGVGGGGHQTRGRVGGCTGKLITK